MQALMLKKDIDATVVDTDLYLSVIVHSRY